MTAVEKAMALKAKCVPHVLTDLRVEAQPMIMFFFGTPGVFAIDSLTSIKDKAFPSWRSFTLWKILTDKGWGYDHYIEMVWESEP